MNTELSASRTGSSPRRGVAARVDEGAPVVPAPLRRPQGDEVRVRLRGLGSMAVASVEAIGPHAVGFARGDRVVFPLTRTERTLLQEPADRDSDALLVSGARLIGVPRDVGDEQAARLLAPGLAARVLLRQRRPVQAGDRVRVDLRAGLGKSVLGAWIAALGATVSGDRGTADIVLDDDAWRQAAETAFRRGHLQVGSADVFGAIREGIFDEVLPNTDAALGSRAAA
jgi:hypothetical protein